VNRLARVYPVYLLALLLLVPLLLVPAWEERFFGDTSLRYRVATFVGHLTLTQGWLPQLTTSWNLPGWSICAEAFFYAVFPFAAAPLSRLGSRALVAVLLGTWLTSLALAVGYVLLDPDGLGGGSPQGEGLGLYVLKFNPLVRLPEFLAGVCLGVLFVRRPAQARGRTGGAWLATAAAGALVAMLVWGEVPYALLHTGALTPLFALLIYALAQGGGPLGALLSVRPLQSLGEASYALYILQLPAMAWAALLGEGLLHTEGAGFRVAYLVGMTGLSLGVFHLVEKPLQAQVRRWLSPRALVQPQAQP
jgi:peptidoglycan/LPS O-acetylase OafA/YrhL